MADRTIDEATQDTNITGVEKVPMSDAHQAKFATTAQLKDYVLAQIAALSSGSFAVATDSIYILRDGVMKRATASDVASAMLDYGFGLDSVASISGSEIVGVKDSSAKKTITITALKTWLESNLTISATVDFDALSPAGVISGTDAFLIHQDANKKITMTDFGSYIHAKFADYVNALDATENIANTDVLYLIQSGTSKKMTLAQLKAHIGAGDTIAPATTTENKIPRWGSAQKTLTDGLAVTTSIAATPEGTKLPTEGAVRTAIDNACGSNGAVKAPASTTAGNIPVWSSTSKTVEDGKALVTSIGASPTDNQIPTAKAVDDALTARGGVGKDGEHSVGNVPTWAANDKLANGYGVRTSVRNSAQADHLNVITERAARDLADGFVSMPASHNENAIPQWGAASELKAGKSVVTVVGSSGSDDNIPTEKAVRDALPSTATTGASGLMSASDKTKMDGLPDLGAIAEVGDALSDADTIIVKKTDVLWKKSLLSRVWAYIMGKLPTFALDEMGATTDVTTLNASLSAHGLMPKLDGSVDNFMRGDGTWAVPSGSSDFTGTDGTNPGIHGLVPAPAITDVNKFLNADGTWTTPPSAAGVDIPGAGAIDALVDTDLAYFFDTSTSGYRKVTAAQIRALVSGTKRYDEIFVAAGAMTPSNTNGATPGAITFENTTHDTMAFTNTKDTSVEFSVVFPDDWDKSTIKFKALWTVFDSTKSETGQHVCFNIGGISCADGETITVSPNPANMVALIDQVDSANELHKTGSSSSYILDGTVANGNLVHFKVTRDADYAPTGGTAMPTEALLLGLQIQYGRTTDYAGW